MSAEVNRQARDRRLQDLLERILEVPAEARRGVLEEAGADRAEIDEVLALLDSEDDAFLAEPPWRQVTAGLADEKLPDLPGYRVRALLGEGGMGRVYLAVDETTDQRLVAIKMVRTPVPDPDLVRRFDAERRALSRLNHPAVAQLYGAGTAPDGRHFVVMEYVDGQPITRYCDERNLDIEQRIELFLAVCRGVEHAHRRRLLHRDLKPSNVLISVLDGRPTPKIIDFGIAQGMDRDDGDAISSDSITGAMPVGTPAYMSPEALGPTDRRDLDTRTDVYSLGVVLYELLTASKPGDDPTGASSSGLGAWHRRPDTPPARPSRRVRDLEPERRRSVAAERGGDGPRLARRLAGDLDWIVLRALAFERDERYGSVAALADDLERSLRHEPVSARPPSLVDRVSKLARRYRLATALALIALAAVTFAAISSSVALVNTRRAEAEARAEAAAARQAIDFLVGLFEAAKPENDQGEEVSARSLVALGAASLRDDDLPPLQRARLLYTLGDVQLRLGDYASGRELAAEALALRESFLEPEHPDLLETLDLLSSLERRAGRLGEAEPYVERLVAAREALGEPTALAAALNTLANLRWRQERFDEAETLHRRALDLRRTALDDAGRLGQDDDAAAADVSASLNNLGVLLWTQKRYDEAEPILREAAEGLEERLGSEHPRVADALGNLSLVVQYQGHLETAVTLQRRVLAIRSKVLGSAHPETATAMDNLAVTLAKLQHIDEAESLYRRALAIRVEALGRDHAHVRRTAQNLRNLYRRSGRGDEADRVEREFPGLEPMPEP